MSDAYVMLPLAVLEHPVLSIGAKLTYAALLKYAWQEDHCWPTQDQLCGVIGVAKNSVRTYLRELADMGFIEIVGRKDRNWHEYRLTGHDVGSNSEPSQEGKSANSEHLDQSKSANSEHLEGKSADIEPTEGQDTEANTQILSIYTEGSSDIEPTLGPDMAQNLNHKSADFAPSKAQILHPNNTQRIIPNDDDYNRHSSSSSLSVDGGGGKEGRQGDQRVWAVVDAFQWDHSQKNYSLMEAVCYEPLFEGLDWAAEARRVSQAYRESGTDVRAPPRLMRKVLSEVLDRSAERLRKEAAAYRNGQSAKHAEAKHDRKNAERLTRIREGRQNGERSGQTPGTDGGVGDATTEPLPIGDPKDTGPTAGEDQQKVRGGARESPQTPGSRTATGR
jgi:hypothetical protein